MSKPTTGDFTKTAGWMDWYTGPSKPRFPLPAGAVDAHCHVFGPGAEFPYAPERKYTPCDASKHQLYALRDHLGFARNVIVQATCHGADNRAMVDACLSSGGKARGVATVKRSVTDEEIQAMHDAGVRGVRMMMLPGGPLGWDALAPLAHQIGPLGWHLNVQFNGCDFVQRLPLLQSLHAQIVLDHTGKFLVPPASTEDAAFQALCRLLDTGRVWVKLSAPYETSQTGAPHYEDVSLLARYLVMHYPERCLWASNWPHPNQNPVPSSAALLNLLSHWVSRTADIQRILVDNPAQLYGFDT